MPSHAWNRWRYHYPQAAFPYERPRRRERPPGQAGSRVRAARHRGLRRRPLLDRRGRLRQGRPARPADDGRGSPTRAPPPTRSTCCRRCGSATPGPGTSTRAKPELRAERRRRSAIEHPFLGDLELLAGAGPDGAAPDAAVLRERDQRRAALRRAGARRTRRTASTTTSSAAPRRSTPTGRDQGGVLVRARGRRPARRVELRLRLRPAGRTARRPAGRTSTRSSPARQARSRRVLRRADTRGAIAPTRRT